MKEPKSRQGFLKTRFKPVKRNHVLAIFEGSPLLLHDGQLSLGTGLYTVALLCICLELNRVQRHFRIFFCPLTFRGSSGKQKNAMPLPGVEEADRCASA